MALSTLGSLKTLLGVTDSSQDALLQQVLDAADAAVKAWCKRDLESQTYTVYLSGSGTPELVLPQRPVTAVSAVYEDAAGCWGDGPNAFGASTLLALGTDYGLVRDGPGGRGESGLLRRLRLAWQPLPSTFAGVAPVWPLGDGNLKVVFTAGYSPVPLDLVEAVNQLAVQMKIYAPTGGMPLTHERLGAYDYQLGLDLLGKSENLADTRRILSRYREP